MVVHLQSVELLRHCSAEQILRLANIARAHRFAPGQEIYACGQGATHLFCLVEGQVRAETPQGDQRWMAPPETFGVREILADQSRTERTVAVDEVLALAFDAGDFFDLLSNNIDIVRALFRQMLSPQPSAGASSGAIADSSPGGARLRAVEASSA